MLIIGLIALDARSTQAQGNACQPLFDATEQLYQGNNRDSTDVLLAIATTAEQARSCYPASDTAKVSLLLHYELWAYQQLERFDAFDIRLALFETVKYAASAYTRADVAMMAMRMLTLRGRFLAATRPYREAVRFRAALPPRGQASLLIDGSYIYQEAEDYEQAEAEANAAIDLAGSSPDMADLLGRALFQRGFISIHTGSPENAPGDLVRSIALLDSTGFVQYLYHAKASLGEAYIRTGRERLADSVFHEVFAGAKHRPNALVNAYLRLGHALLATDRSDAAEEVLRKGLAVSDSALVGEYRFRLWLHLADALRRQGRVQAARSTLLDLLALDPDSNPGASYRLLRAQREAEKLVLRIDLDEGYVPPSWKYATYIGSIFFLIALFFALHYRRLWLRDRTPSALSEVPELVDRRRAYIYFILFGQPQGLLPKIKEARLRNRLTSGVLDVPTLLRLAAALELSEEHVHLKRPVATYKQMFRRIFPKRGWTVPDSIEEWKQHFEDHPLPASMNTRVADIT